MALLACPEFSHLDQDSARQVMESIREFCSILAGSYKSFQGSISLETSDE
jgi:hypothetical protein